MVAGGQHDYKYRSVWDITWLSGIKCHLPKCHFKKSDILHTCPSGSIHLAKCMDLSTHPSNIPDCRWAQVLVHDFWSVKCGLDQIPFMEMSGHKAQDPKLLWVPAGPLKEIPIYNQIPITLYAVYHSGLCTHKLWPTCSLVKASKAGQMLVDSHLTNILVNWLTFTMGDLDQVLTKICPRYGQDMVKTSPKCTPTND